MLGWLSQRKAQTSPDGRTTKQTDEAPGEVTDDPLAAIDPNRKGQKIYSVSRSVLLPKSSDGACDSGGGTNPLFDDTISPSSTLQRQKSLQTQPKIQDSSSDEKCNSSGYGGSHGEGSSHGATYSEKIRLSNDAVSVLEQNSNYVKSIQVATSVSGKLNINNNNNNNKSVPSSGSGSSAAGTLTTIPEGRVDFGIPRPIWPRFVENMNEKRRGNSYDSLVDEALLLYTNANYIPIIQSSSTSGDKVNNITLKDFLDDLSNSISATIEGKNGVSPEQMLKSIREKISSSLEVIKNSTEEEMRKLSVNLSNREKVGLVVRAFRNNSSSSGNSSQSSPELNSARVRTISADTEDIYQVPSGSSSSGFSDSYKPYAVSKRLTSEDDMRNAIIYGTISRATNVKSCASASEKLLDNEQNKSSKEVAPKISLLQAPSDSKPSVWQQYYGVNLVQQGDIKYFGKATDVPRYPGGRPEADFTLDVPRSELLSKRMKEDKKWRCRCRLLTSFLGLIFFLLSVMAVSLMLTRGKRMFGSMV